MPCAARAKRGARDDQLPRHQAVVDDLARVVDVVDELVQRADPLRQPALDRVPLGGGDDPRDEVERERPVLHRAGAAGVERDALLHEDRVAPLAGGDERLGAELAQRAHERARVRAREPLRVDQLVVEVLFQRRQERETSASAAPRARDPRA